MENMFRPLPLLNQIGKVDLTFLLIVIGAIVLAVAFYFMIPLFRRKQYKEARENLRKREEAFKASTGSAILSSSNEQSFIEEDAGKKTSGDGGFSAGPADEPFDGGVEG